MRAILSTFGSLGDVQPMLALAENLRRSGHCPVLALSPNFAERAQEIGVEFVPTGPLLPLDSIRRVISGQMQSLKPADQVRRFLEVVLPCVPEIYHNLSETCVGADVLIGSPYQLACRMVHEKTSIPFVSLHLSQFADLGGAETREVSSALINPYRLREGLPAVADPLGRDGSSSQLALYAVSPEFLHRPARWRDHNKVVGFFFLDQVFEPEPKLADFCSGAQAPVVVTFGSIVHSDPKLITDLILDAVAKLGRHVVLQQGWSGLGGAALPEYVFAAGYVPHSWLFPRASVVVHHGGAGTSAAAFRAGVPAVIVPHTLDQPIWAELARAKGCARNVIPFAQLSAARLAAAIKGTLNTPSVYQAAETLGGRIRQENGTAVATRLIEELLESHGSKAVRLSNPAGQTGAERQGVAMRLPKLTRSDSRKDLPLSFAQQRLWFLNQLDPTSWAYNGALCLRLEGNLDRTSLRRSFDELVKRHEILRTTFRSFNPEPVQVIAEPTEVEIEEVDVKNVGRLEREAVVAKLSREEAEKPFDLANGPLLRVKLLCLGDREHVLLVTIHHIVSDAWSSDVMFREISLMYEAYVKGREPDLPELPVQYADFAKWQREWFDDNLLANQLDYWREQLESLPTLELPTDRPRTAATSHSGAARRFQVPKNLTTKLKDLSRREEATVFMVLLAALQITLAKYSGERDVAVGTAIANRTRTELENLIGFFANTLVLRTDLSGAVRFPDLLRRVKKICLGAYAHQDLPFEKIVEELHPKRDLARSPFFQVMLLVQSGESEELRLHGLRVSESPLMAVGAMFDVTLQIVEKPDGLQGEAIYAPELFDAATMDRVIAHFLWLLERVSAEPECLMNELYMPTEAEKRRVIVEWNDTEIDYPQKCLHELFEEQAEKTPTAVAVECAGEQLSYAELNLRANQLAHHLRGLGAGPEVRVGICLSRGLKTLVGLLGILKSGGAYLPLDAAYPADRLGFLLRDSQIPLLVTQSGMRGGFSDSAAVVVEMDGDWARIAEKSGTNPHVTMATENAAYIIYTSGSTGQPKGVVVRHRSLVNVLLSMGRIIGGTSGRVVATTSLSFDIAALELFLPLLVGGQVRIEDVVPSRGGLLGETLRSARADWIQMTPSGWRLAINAEWSGDPQMTLLCGGEVLDGQLAGELLKHCGHLWNLYGPTETTVWSSFHAVNDKVIEATIPIGRPIANTEIYVLDSDCNAAPVGVAGELYIGGAGLARGYLNRPELTAEKFIPHRFSKEPGARLYRTGDRGRWREDGAIEFLGRVDDQVKIRGYRIELGEVEAVLREIAGVSDAAVVVREDEPGQKRLAAYVVASDRQRQGEPREVAWPRSVEEPGRYGNNPLREQQLSQAVPEIRRHLVRKLPDYMVPAAIVFLDALPLTPNGKIDRRKLPIPSSERPEQRHSYVPPQTALQKVLANIWQEALKIEKLGLDDDFFDLGGHSLLATSTISRIRATLGVNLPLRYLFEAPTIRQFANLIVAREACPGEAESIAQVVASVQSMTALEVRKALQEERSGAN